MPAEHCYYLHTNGELIAKVVMDGIEADFRESDFVVAFWFLDVKNREDACRECRGLGFKSVDNLSEGAVILLSKDYDPNKEYDFKD